MGLIAKLKSFFNKNIECEENMQNHIVFLLEKKRFLYINKNIIVRDGTVCVVVYKSRVADVILPGKYKINEQVIPETFHRSKADKVGKHGAKVKRIRVDLYFVNTMERKIFDFDSDEPFLIKSKELGRIKGYLQGTCNIRVIDPAILIKCLINETGKEKNNEVDTDVGLWIGNKINKRIEKNKTTIEMLFNNHDFINAMLNTDLEDAYDNIGIFVKNIKLRAVNFPKKYQKKTNQYLPNIKKVSTSAIVSNSNIMSNTNSGEVKVAISPNIGTRTQSSSTMQNSQKNLYLNDFKVCNKCGFKNRIDNNICNNCGNKI